MAATHTIDWDKIKTIEDVKLVLRFMSFEIDPALCPIDKKYLKLIHVPKIVTK